MHHQIGANFYCVSPTHPKVGGSNMDLISIDFVAFVLSPTHAICSWHSNAPTFEIQDRSCHYNIVSPLCVWLGYRGRLGWQGLCLTKAVRRSYSTTTGCRYQSRLFWNYNDPPYLPTIVVNQKYIFLLYKNTLFTWTHTHIYRNLSAQNEMSQLASN